jgi:peptide/nickel transport system substrate-binding protein
MLRFLSRAHLAVALVLLAHTASGTEPPVVVVQPFLAGTLDPAISTEGWALQSHGIAETLFTVAPDGMVVPQIAESAEPAADGSWTIRLRPDWKFSDGSPVDAAAVRDSLLDGTERNPLALSQTGRMEIDVADPATLRISTAKPVPVMPSVLAEYFHVVHKREAGAGQAGSDRMVFTGPYRVTQFRKDDRIELEPNLSYPLPARRRPVVVRKVVDAQARALALESGEADLAFQLPPESLERLRARGFAVKSTLVGYQYLLFLNGKRPGLSEQPVRQAIDLGINRTALVTALRGGEPATGFYPNFYRFAAREARPYDPARANRLLDESGWQRGANGVRTKGADRLAFTLLSVTQAAEYGYMALLIKDDLARIGINIEVKGVERSMPFLMAGDFDIGFNFTHAAPGGDPAFVLEQFFRSSGPRNYSKVPLPGLDPILDELAKTYVPDQRDAIARKAQSIIFAQVPAAFLMTPVWHIGLSARLPGYRPYPSDYYIVQADMGLPP